MVLFRQKRHAALLGKRDRQYEILNGGLMEDFSTLIGGIAGDGINEAGLTVARLFNRLGYRIYMYYDYPSLIRGGHNYSLVRASR